MKKLFAVATLAVALALAGCGQPAEPGKNIPECRSGDPCDYTKGT